MIRAGSRPPLERMQRVHQELVAGRFPNAYTLAAQLEVSYKTISRDLAFMRDRMELPIDFDPARNGFYYTQEVTSFPSLQITEGELFALVVAEKALEQYRGTNFEKPLLGAIKKVASALPDTISINLADLGQTISFRHRAEPILNLEVFKLLADATAHQRQLELKYKKPGAPEAETRVVDPYHLANINGEWFLFAYDHLRKDIRTFVPARMQSVRHTGQTFARPARFSLEKRLRDSFGVHTGAGRYEVVLHFDASVAQIVREKKWHESQQLTALAEGGLELRMQLSSLVEIERWVLSWGGHCRVLSPAELADAVRTAARRLLK